MKSETLWKDVLNELALQMPRATFNTWLLGTKVLEPSPGTAVGDNLIIGVRNDYAVDWLENRLRGTIERCAKAIAGHEIRISYRVFVDNDPPSETKKPIEKSGSKRPSPPPKKTGRDNNPVRFEKTRRATHPLTGFVPVTHYATRFWQPYMESHGRGSFALLLILSSYAYEVETYNSSGPNIKQLARKMGWGDWTTFVGRKASGGNKAKVGLFGVLRQLRICDHVAEGKGRGQIQIFRYLTKVQDLPLLTPKQVAEMHPDDQEEHANWLNRHTAISPDEWLKDTRESGILPFPTDTL